MKYLVRIIFRRVARLIISRYHPVVIGVAGSVGKTATKDAVAAGLDSPQISARKTVGNFNAEIGVPATIMAPGGPPRSAGGWLRIFFRGGRQAIFGGPYPKILILEMAADHPGDLNQLINIARPSVGVLTSAAPEHLEFFGDERAVAEEESLIVKHLTAADTAIINIDDQRIASLRPTLKCKVITYGWNPAAMVKADSFSVTKDNQVLPDGMVVKVSLDGGVIPISLPGVIGRHQAYPILAAMAVGRVMGLEAMTVVKHLSAYVPPPGRMRLFHGRDGSLLIDDSYNASPEAVLAALQTLSDLDMPNDKIAVLGQMSELGSAAVDWHDRIVRQLARLRVQRIVTVGALAARIGQAAVAAGFSPEAVYNVDHAAAAAAVVMPWLAPGVTVLLKGSRYAARLEQAAAILLDNPDRDSSSLVTMH